MFLVRDVIENGMMAYRSGTAFHNNPYPSVPEDEQHESVVATRCCSLGGCTYYTNKLLRVRVAIDYSVIWEIGWNLGEMLEPWITE